MDMPLISVIVPVYKVEKYLDRCVQSIVDQTYRNLEIILVDDGSPDNCGAMCDAWAAKDSRIKVIHKTNGGLSDARNAGMAIATGEYIGFVDSDDHIAPEMYQLLYDRLEADGSDIAAGGVQMAFEDGTPARMLTKAVDCVLSRQEAMEAIISETGLKQPVWYKLYKAALVRDISFPEGKLHEDVFWSWQAVARANRVSVFDTPCYFYTQRSGSIMGESYSLKRLDAIEAKLIRQQHSKERFPEQYALAIRDLWGSCIYAKQMLLRYCDTQTQKQGSVIVKQAFKQYPIQWKYFNWKDRKQSLWLTMTKLSVTMTCKIRNKLGVGF